MDRNIFDLLQFDNEEPAEETLKPNNEPLLSPEQCIAKLLEKKKKKGNFQVEPLRKRIDPISSYEEEKMLREAIQSSLSVKKESPVRESFFDRFNIILKDEVLSDKPSLACAQTHNSSNDDPTTPRGASTGLSIKVEPLAPCCLSIKEEQLSPCNADNNHNIHGNECLGEEDVLDVNDERQHLPCDVFVKMEHPEEMSECCSTSLLSSSVHEDVENNDDAHIDLEGKSSDEIIDELTKHLTCGTFSPLLDAERDKEQLESEFDDNFVPKLPGSSNCSEFVDDCTFTSFSVTQMREKLAAALENNAENPCLTAVSDSAITVGDTSLSSNLPTDPHHCETFPYESLTIAEPSNEKCYALLKERIRVPESILHRLPAPNEESTIDAADSDGSTLETSAANVPPQPARLTSFVMRSSLAIDYKRKRALTVAERRILALRYNCPASKVKQKQDELVTRLNEQFSHKALSFTAEDAYSSESRKSPVRSRYKPHTSKTSAKSVSIVLAPTIDDIDVPATIKRKSLQVRIKRLDDSYQIFPKDASLNDLPPRLTQMPEIETTFPSRGSSPPVADCAIIDVSSCGSKSVSVCSEEFPANEVEMENPPDEVEAGMMPTHEAWDTADGDVGMAAADETCDIAALDASLPHSGIDLCSASEKSSTTSESPSLLAKKMLKELECSADFKVANPVNCTESQQSMSREERALQRALQQIAQTEQEERTSESGTRSTLTETITDVRCNSLKKLHSVKVKSTKQSKLKMAAIRRRAALQTCRLPVKAAKRTQNGAGLTAHAAQSMSAARPRPGPGRPPGKSSPIKVHVAPRSRSPAAASATSPRRSVVITPKRRRSNSDRDGGGGGLDGGDPDHRRGGDSRSRNESAPACGSPTKGAGGGGEGAGVGGVPKAEEETESRTEGSKATAADEKTFALVCRMATRDKRDNRGRTALHVAARAGHMMSVQFSLANGCDPNARDHDGWTPLHHAIERRHCDVVEQLVSAGADVNTSSGGDGWRPLHHAVRADCVAVFDILVRNGADPHTGTYCGLSLLDACASEVMRQAVRRCTGTGPEEGGDGGEKEEEDNYDEEQIDVEMSEDIMPEIIPILEKSSDHSSSSSCGVTEYVSLSALCDYLGVSLPHFFTTHGARAGVTVRSFEARRLGQLVEGALTASCAAADPDDAHRQILAPLAATPGRTHTLVRYTAVVRELMAAELVSETFRVPRKKPVQLLPAVVKTEEQPSQQQYIEPGSSPPPVLSPSDSPLQTSPSSARSVSATSASSPPNLPQSAPPLDTNCSPCPLKVISFGALDSTTTDCGVLLDSPKRKPRLAPDGSVLRSPTRRGAAAASYLRRTVSISPGIALPPTGSNVIAPPVASATVTLARRSASPRPPELSPMTGARSGYISLPSVGSSDETLHHNSSSSTAPTVVSVMPPCSAYSGPSSEVAYPILIDTVDESATTSAAQYLPTGSTSSGALPSVSTAQLPRLTPCHLLQQSTTPITACEAATTPTFSHLEYPLGDGDGAVLPTTSVPNNDRVTSPHTNVVPSTNMSCAADTPWYCSYSSSDLQNSNRSIVLPVSNSTVDQDRPSYSGEVQRVRNRSGIGASQQPGFNQPSVVCTTSLIGDPNNVSECCNSRKVDAISRFANHHSSIQGFPFRHQSPYFQADRLDSAIAPPFDFSHGASGVVRGAPPRRVAMVSPTVHTTAAQKPSVGGTSDFQYRPKNSQQGLIKFTLSKARLPSVGQQNDNIPVVQLVASDVPRSQGVGNYGSSSAQVVRSEMSRSEGSSTYSSTVSQLSSSALSRSEYSGHGSTISQLIDSEVSHTESRGTHGSSRSPLHMSDPSRSLSRSTHGSSSSQLDSSDAPRSQSRSAYASSKSQVIYISEETPLQRQGSYGSISSQVARSEVSPRLQSRGTYESSISQPISSVVPRSKANIRYGSINSQLQRSKVPRSDSQGIQASSSSQFVDSEMPRTQSHSSSGSSGSKVVTSDVRSVSETISKRRRPTTTAPILQQNCSSVLKRKKTTSSALSQPDDNLAAFAPATKAVRAAYTPTKRPPSAYPVDPGYSRISSEQLESSHRLTLPSNGDLVTLARQRLESSTNSINLSVPVSALTAPLPCRRKMAMVRCATPDTSDSIVSQVEPLLYTPSYSKRPDSGDDSEHADTSNLAVCFPPNRSVSPAVTEVLDDGCVDLT